MKKALNFNINLAYYCLVIFLPLSWIVLLDIGKTSIKLVHLAIFPLLICCFFRSFRAAVIYFTKANKALITLFCLLMVMNFISMAVNTDIQDFAKSAQYIIKNLSYLFFFVFFVGAMSILFVDSANFYKKLAISGAICIGLFITVSTIILKAHGHNFLIDMAKYFLSGDMNGLRHDIYTSMFNTGKNIDEELAAALINTLTGSFIFVHFTSLYAFHNLKTRFHLGLCVFNLVLSFWFIIANISRSNIIAFGLGYCIYWFFDIYYNNNKKRILQVGGGFVVLLTVTLIFWDKIIGMFSDTADMYVSRFGNLDQNARWRVNAEAISTFTKNPFNFIFGLGSGAVASDGHAVHNFILGSAYQAGIFGLILSVLVYLSFFQLLFKYAPTLTKYKNAFLISSIMSIPLIRMMESGNAGTLTFQEWFCFAFFLGFVIKKNRILSCSNEITSKIIS